MLVDIPPSRILGRWIPEPLPPPGTFNGQTVLVTGGTTGLGLAAAIHFARLGAEVIITYRSAGRGKNAQRQIEEAANIVGQGKVSGFELDMERYDSCVAFVDALKKSRQDKSGLDVAVLNAGSINPRFTKSPEGWEQTLQVNTLSTTLLGLLLLSYLKSERPTRSSPAHIVFVTSRDHLYPDITHWASYAANPGLLTHFSDPQHWSKTTTEPNYATSKLLVMYAVQEMARMALDDHGSPQVLINSICPGLVHTDIGRAIAGQSAFMKVVVALYLTLLGKTPDLGARHYVKAAFRTPEEHGRFKIAWLAEEGYQRKAADKFTSGRGKEVQALAWREIIRELSAKVPVVRELGLDLHGV